MGVVSTIPGAGCWDQVGPDGLCGGCGSGWCRDSRAGTGFSPFTRQPGHKVLCKMPPAHPGAQNHHVHPPSWICGRAGVISPPLDSLRVWGSGGFGWGGSALCPVPGVASSQQRQGHEGHAEPAAWAQNRSAVVTSSCWPWWGSRRALQSVGAERVRIGASEVISLRPCQFLLERASGVGPVPLPVLSAETALREVQ